jgi:hypothetical protein
MMGARVFKIALFLFALVFPHHAQAQQDGNWWRDKLNEGMRIGYVIGFLDGLDNAATLAPLVACEGPDGKPGLGSIECVDRIRVPIANRLHGGFRGMSYGQIKDGVDAVFADFKNRKLLVQGVIRHVARSASGRSAPDLERDLEMMRGATK